jgi:hypothetical protein
VPQSFDALGTIFAYIFRVYILLEIVNKLRLFTQFFLTKKLHGLFLFFFRSPLREKEKRKTKFPLAGLTMSAGWKGHLVNLMAG